MPLAELEYDHNVLSNRHSMDAKLYIRFFVEVLPDEQESAKQKRKVFRDVEMITIMVPGNKKEVRTREIREEDKQRFEAQYERWVRTKQEVPDGYPLSDWNIITSPALKEELKYMGFQTVEQLANASESVMANAAGLRQYQQKAAQWLQVQAERAPVEKLAAELAERDDSIKELQRQMAELINTMKGLKPA